MSRAHRRKSLRSALLGLFAAPRLNMHEDYPKVREFQRRVAALRGGRTQRGVSEQVMTDGDGPPIAVRVFQPSERRRDDVLVFFHGGGWVTGDIQSYTPACTTMAELTGAVVASVDYRLAPEHPYPAGLQDCFRVARQLLEHPERAGIADARSVVLVGDSAGGNLAAVVSLMLKERGLKGADRQILLYPVTHWDHDPATSPFGSVRVHGEDYRLTNTEVRDYQELYVPDPARRKDPHVAPLMAPDLSGQPETLVITAELDLLCDEGEAYGAALRAAGNAVRVHRVDGALHGFIALPRFAAPLREAYGVINEFLDAGAIGPDYVGGEG